MRQANNAIYRIQLLLAIFNKAILSIKYLFFDGIWTKPGQTAKEQMSTLQEICAPQSKFKSEMKRPTFTNML